jgi:hypothetical protein
MEVLRGSAGECTVLAIIFLLPTEENYLCFHPLIDHGRHFL